MTVEVQSKKLEIDAKTFQPKITAVVSVQFTLEAMQDINASGPLSELYAKLGKDIFDAIGSYKEIENAELIEPQI